MEVTPPCLRPAAACPGLRMCVCITCVSQDNHANKLICVVRESERTRGRDHERNKQVSSLTLLTSSLQSKQTNKKQ